MKELKTLRQQEVDAQMIECTIKKALIPLQLRKENLEDRDDYLWQQRIIQTVFLIKIIHFMYGIMVGMAIISMIVLIKNILFN